MKTLIDEIREIERELNLSKLPLAYLKDVDQQKEYHDWLMQKDTSARIETNDF